MLGGDPNNSRLIALSLRADTHPNAEDSKRKMDGARAGVPANSLLAAASKKQKFPWQADLPAGKKKTILPLRLVLADEQKVFNPFLSYVGFVPASDHLFFFH